MIFWIERDFEISYNMLIEDLKNGESSINLSGYNYFLKLLQILINDYIPENPDDLINYILVNKDRLSFQIHTSGTTSTPKLVDIKLKNCVRYVKINNNSEKRIWGMGYPVGSYASTQVFFQSLMNKETILYLFGMDFKLADEIFSNYLVTNLSCTPTFLSMLLINFQKKHPSVVKITTGGEKIKKGLIDAFKKIFIRADYINIYASTETGSLLYSKSEFFKIEEKYKNLLKIFNDTLWVHESLLNNINNLEDGWYNTNDLVEFIDNKRFKFVSRSNGYLNTGGYRISPSEVEEAILKIQNVIDVHVYGKSNSILGTILCADIIGDKLSSKKIKKELISSIEKHKIPQVIRLVKFFEHVNNGKKKIMI